MCVCVCVGGCSGDFSLLQKDLPSDLFKKLFPLF